MFKKVTKIALAGVIGVSMMVGSSSLVSADPEDPLVYQSEAKIKFIPNEDSTPPVDPEDPNTDVEFGEDDQPTGTPGKGELTIDYASDINFGEVEISGNERTYIAKSIKLFDEEERAPYVQVTDDRGQKEGWHLQVNQEGEFKTLDDEDLGKTTLTLNDSKANSVNGIEGISEKKSIELTPTGGAQDVFGAVQGYGAGTYTNMFGKVSDGKAESISLVVPGDLTISKKEYSVDLTWTLIAGPKE